MNFRLYSLPRFISSASAGLLSPSESDQDLKSDSLKPHSERKRMSVCDGRLCAPEVSHMRTRSPKCRPASLLRSSIAVTRSWPSVPSRAERGLRAGSVKGPMVNVSGFADHMVCIATRLHGREAAADCT